jgi:hypothetical protein
VIKNIFLCPFSNINKNQDCNISIVNFNNKRYYFIKYGYTKLNIETLNLEKLKNYKD